MERKKPLNFILLIVVIILGGTLFKQFNFEQLRFKHNGLAIIYLITFVACMYLLLKKDKDRSEN
jgi:predicted ferric reductase